LGGAGPHVKCEMECSARVSVPTSGRLDSMGLCRKHIYVCYCEERSGRVVSP
jgi:hypothetical protein